MKSDTFIFKKLNFKAYNHRTKGVFINTLVGGAGQLKIFVVKLFWPPFASRQKFLNPPSTCVKTFLTPPPLLHV